jgi:hypothetical protein
MGQDTLDTLSVDAGTLIRSDHRAILPHLQ